LGDQIKEEGIGRTCNTHGETRSEYSMLVGKPEETT